MLPLFVFKQDSANKINSKDASTRTVIDPKSSLSPEREKLQNRQILVSIMVEHSPLRFFAFHLSPIHVSSVPGTGPGSRHKEINDIDVTSKKMKFQKYIPGCLILRELEFR